MKSFSQFCDEHQVFEDEKKSLLYYLIAIRIKNLINDADNSAAAFVNVTG